MWPKKKRRSIEAPRRKIYFCYYSTNLEGRTITEITKHFYAKHHERLINVNAGYKSGFEYAHKISWASFTIDMLMNACNAYTNIGLNECDDNAMGIAQYLRELIWQRLEKGISF